jgi:hypothetical protein
MPLDQVVEEYTPQPQSREAPLLSQEGRRAKRVGVVPDRPRIP